MESIESGELFCDSKFIESNGREANEYRKIGKFCDFTLKLKSTGASIKVHKVVLASSCPYFNAMFQSEMIECGKGYLELEDFITETELENVIEYLYTGCISIPFSSAKVYYEHAIYFRLRSLANLCTGLMIRNINLETCLDLWRFGVKFSNEKLSVNSLEYILRNASSLFENDSSLNLTAEEIKILISDDKMVCTEEKIFTFVMKWLNHDFDSRTMDFNQLIEDIRFPLMTDEFLKSEVLSNDFLLENQDFHKTATKILKSKLNTAETSCLKLGKINSPRVAVFKQKHMVALLDKKIYHFGLEEDNVLPMASLTDGMHIGARITTFGKNCLLLAGGSNSKNCEHYCPVTHMVKPFPSMNKGRCGHGITTLHDKIYCCGGVRDDSVEVFDVGAGFWTEGSRMNREQYNFGITRWDNAIYVMGGYNHANGERYDPREDKWCLLPVMPADFNAALTRSFAFNNAVYAFTNAPINMRTGFIFDIRANKWMKKYVSSPPHEWDCFDLTQTDGKVYAMGELWCSSDPKHYCYTYDITTNTWLDTAQKLPEHKAVSVVTMFT